jgi:hypothetical protein
MTTNDVETFITVEDRGWNAQSPRPMAPMKAALKRLPRGLE